MTVRRARADLFVRGITLQQRHWIPQQQVISYATMPVLLTTCSIHHTKLVFVDETCRVDVTAAMRAETVETKSSLDLSYRVLTVLAAKIPHDIISW